MSIEVKDGQVSIKLDGSYTAEELLELVDQIGQARSQIANDPQTLQGEKTSIRAVVGPSYWTEYKIEINASLLAFRHPGLGWIGLCIPAPEVAKLIGFFSLQLAAAAASTAATQPAIATNPNLDQGSGGGLLH